MQNQEDASLQKVKVNRPGSSGVPAAACDLSPEEVQSAVGATALSPVRKCRERGKRAETTAMCGQEENAKFNMQKVRNDGDMWGNAKKAKPGIGIWKLNRTVRELLRSGIG